MSTIVTLPHLQGAALSTLSDFEESEDLHSDTEIRQTLQASDESSESDADVQELSDQERYMSASVIHKSTVVYT